MCHLRLFPNLSPGRRSIHLLPEQSASAVRQSEKGSLTLARTIVWTCRNRLLG